MRSYSPTVRFYGLALAGTLALVAHVRPDAERFYCGGERVTFELLAERRGVPAGDVAALRAMGFTARTLCEAREDIIRKGIRNADRERTGKVKPDHPGEWLEWRKQSLRDETGEIDPEGLMRAKAHVDQMRAQAPAERAGITRGAWTSIGPGNIGGRVRAMVIKPTDANTMFVGSVGGGIWKTTNGGTLWSVVDDFMANLAVTSIVIDPSNADVMYAGTGEGFWNADGIRGAGIFKSTDGGTTWTQLAATSTAPSAGIVAADFYYVNRLSMNTTGSVLAVATQTGIFRSTNGGTSFTKATMVGGSAISAGNGIADLDFNKSDATKAVAGTYAGTAFYSSDSGATWTLATGLPGGGTFRRVETAVGTSTPGVVYASVDLQGGWLYRSTDNGASYAAVFNGSLDSINPLGGQGWYDNMLFVSPTDANFVVWGGIDLFRSTNGGSAFAKISEWFSHSYSNPTSAHADQHIAVPHPAFDGTSNRIVFFGNDGGIYRAADVATVGGGASPYQSGWTELNNGLAITQFYGGAGHVATGKVTGGTQDNGTLLYNPALSTPSEAWTAPFGGDGGWSAYDPAAANTFYGEYVYLTVHRSLNGTSSDFINGLHWNGAAYVCKPAPYKIGDGVTDGCSPTSYGIGAQFIAPFIIDPNNANRLLAGGLRLWRTNDATTANTAATGPSWASIKASVSSNITAIAVAPGNPDLLWVGHLNGNVYRAPDGTATTPTWTQRDTTTPTLPNRQVMRITVGAASGGVHPVYVAFGGFNGDNLWRSVNGGDSWTDITGSGLTGLPDVPVRDLEIHPTNPAWLYAATEVGVFASTDTGATWGLPQEGPSNVSVDELFFLGNKLYAVTHGRGMFWIDTNSEFTDATLTAGVTPIKAIHITELRTRVAALRAGRGLSVYSFTDPTLTSAIQVKAVHIVELRAALADVYQSLQQTAPTYTDNSLSGVAVKAVHVQELRSAVIAVGG
jgi:hypothetical protein